MSVIITYSPKPLMSKKAQYDYIDVDEKRVRINLKFGDTQVTDKQFEKLKTNPVFVNHLENSVISAIEVKATTETNAPEAKVTQSTTSPARTKKRKTEAVA